MRDRRTDSDFGLEAGLDMGGDSFKESIKFLNTIDPSLAEFLVAYGYGKIMRRAHLPLQDKELVIVSTLAVLGLQPQLKWHLNAALNIGVEAETLAEVLAQAIPFAGWPIALNALGVFREVIGIRGISLPNAVASDNVAEPTDLTAIMTKAEENGRAVYGAEFDQLIAALADIEPTLPELLLESAFGRIYSRPGLTLRQREIVAVSMLAALQRQQLEAHVRGALRVGATPDELREAFILMHGYAGWPVALSALAVWKKVVNP